MRSPAARVLDDILTLSEREHYYGDLESLLAAAGRPGWVAGLDPDVEPAEGLRKLRKGPAVDLTASFLMRLLAVDRTLIDNSPLRVRIAEFLDGQYGDALRPYYERPARGGTHEILSSLQAVVPALEAEAAQLIASLRGLSALAAFRQGLMHLIGGSPGRIVIRPFLPQDALGSALTDLFDMAEKVRDADDDVATMHRRLEQQTRELEELSSDFGTKYSRDVLAAAVTAVGDAGRRKMELTRPPAKLRFEAAGKPLPLLEPGATSTVKFTVFNEGPSPASDLRIRLTGGTEIVLLDTEFRVGDLAVGSAQQAAVDLTVREAVSSSDLGLAAKWLNPDYSLGEANGTIRLTAQTANIDWDQMEELEPFAPYPVEEPRDLIGRARHVRRLRARTAQVPLANLYVTGQRRVGKTSLVRTLLADLSTSEGVAIAFVELGEARHIDERETVGALGRKLAERLLDSAALREVVDLPSFGESLAPLTDVVDAARRHISELRVLFIIDEFDELPHDLYRRGGPGDALFLPMRSLAQKPYVGWLLVGGEKLPFIQDEQATRLNTFSRLDIGYLPLHGESRDAGQEFADLVRRPLPTGFTVDEEAVRAIHEESAGNPHFAKSICASLFELARQARDAYITADDVVPAAELANRTQDVELFFHFWEDGIFDSEARARRKELNRRVFLEAIADVARSTRSIESARVIAECERRGLPRRQASQLQQEFMNREILVQDNGRDLRVRVPLFRRWLENEGIYKLAPRGLNEEISGRIVEEEERSDIRPEEIRRLLDRWGGFKFRGESITRDRVEQWLEQFDSAVERRLVFRLVERMRVISDAEIHEGFRGLQRLVARPSTITMRPGQRALTHLLVAPIGPEGSSGQAFVYRYRQANNISGHNVVSFDALPGRVARASEVASVVLIDDFLGSGHTAISALESLADVETEGSERLEWYLFALSGSAAGVAAVHDSEPGQALGLRVELAYPLEDRNQPFGARSTVFSDSDERGEAERVVRSFGERLWPAWPLGYKDGAALICFPDNCPNNVPPIFWSDANGWRPLFRRTAR